MLTMMCGQDATTKTFLEAQPRFPPTSLPSFDRS